MQPHRALPFLSAILLASTSIASAQIAAELRGRVLDDSGAAVPNARVELTQASTNLHQSTLSTTTGDYVFINLAPGSYSLNVTAARFQNLSRTGITVITGQTVTADLTLTIGGDQQTVTVTGDLPLLQSATSNIQTNISHPDVVAMPLNTRNFVQLTTLAPGIELPPGTLLPRINGGRPRTNEYLYDGISALQPEPGQVAFFPILDDIQEFTVEANNVPAEFGRFNGGVVNVSTRSGSNALHGSLFEFLRNEDLNARNYFSTTGRKPEYRRNLYGGTLGLPILRNRLFFFGDFQGVRQLIGVTRISTIPTMNERQGIFTGVSKIYNPATTQFVSGKYVRQEFPSDTINTPFDPAAAALARALPHPHQPHRQPPTTTPAPPTTPTTRASSTPASTALSAPAIAPSAATPTTTKWSSRSRRCPMAAALISGSVLGTGGVAGLSNVLGQQAVFNETHTFSPRLLNDFRLGYTRRGNTIAGATPWRHRIHRARHSRHPHQRRLQQRPAALHLHRIPAARPLRQHLLAISDRRLAARRQPRLHARPAHLKAGADLRWYQLNAVAPPNPTGSFAFTTTGTNQQGVTNSGNSIASFLLGQVDTFQIDLQESKIRPRDHIEEYFVQDDWKVTNRLTANIGARWTLHFPSVEKNNQGAVFNLADAATRLPRRQRQLPQRPRAALRQTSPRASASLTCSRPRPSSAPASASSSSISPASPRPSPRRSFPSSRTSSRRRRTASTPPSRSPAVLPSRPFPLNAECRTRPKRLHRPAHRRLRLRAAVEPRRPARDHQQPVRGIRLHRLAHRPRRHSRLKPQPAHRRPARPGLFAAHAGHQSLLRPVAHLQFHRRKNRQRRATSQALSALPQRRHLPPQQRRNQLQRRRGQRSSAASPTDSLCSSATRTRASSTMPRPSSPPPCSLRQTPAASSPPTPSAPRSSATSPPATCPTSPHSAASTICPSAAAIASHQPASPTASSADGLSTPSSPCNPACPSP